MWRTESSIDVTRNGYLLDETDLVLHGLANDHEQLVVRLLHHVCLVTQNWLFSDGRNVKQNYLIQNFYIVAERFLTTW